MTLKKKLIIKNQDRTNVDFLLGMEYIYSSKTWKRIDHNSNTVTGITSSSLNSHPIFSKIVDTTVDGCLMVEIPRFYFLYNQTSTGHKWWIGNFKFALNNQVSKIHPAFNYNGNQVRKFLVSKYEVSQDPSDSNKATSAYNVSFLNSLTLAQLKQRCEARNVNGVTGFSSINIYQIAALQMLVLFDLGNPDSQTLIGNGQSSSACKTGKSNVNWRGIGELWGNGPHLVAGLENRSGKLYIWNNAGDETFVDTGVNTVLASSGSFLSNLSPDMAAKGLFIPNEVNSTITNAMFPDKFWSKNSGTMVCTHGGSWTSKEGAGLYNLGLDNAASAVATTRYTTRLVKI